MSKIGTALACEACGNKIVADSPYKKYCSHSCYRRVYNQKNKDKIAARQKECRQKNKEMIAARKKEYHQKNKEKLAARRKEYYQKNKEKNLEKCSLRYIFGTSALPLKIKQNAAMAHLGKRIYDGRTKELSKDKIKSIINRIEKGDTYAAYE